MGATGSKPGTEIPKDDPEWLFTALMEIDGTIKSMISGFSLALTSTRNRTFSPIVDCMGE